MQQACVGPEDTGITQADVAVQYTPRSDGDVIADFDIRTYDGTWVNAKCR